MDDPRACSTEWSKSEKNKYCMKVKAAQSCLTLWNPMDYTVGEENGTPLQCSCLENPMDGGAWLAAVHGVAKNQTWLSDFTFTFHFPALEKEMATHSSVLAWRIPWTEKPGRLQSMGSHGVGHDWSDLAAAGLYSPWNSPGQNIGVGYMNRGKWCHISAPPFPGKQR